MKEMAYQFLVDAFGSDAKFRNGQLESIESILTTGRELVVQQTGWGKSLVYFITTNIYRSKGKGLTIIVSPLLSLIRNQIESAKDFNLKSRALSSANSEEWEDIYEEIKLDSIDVLFLTPEHLANEQNIDKLNSILTKQISLLVIDEAHCISDWGHDFRPDYKKIVDFIDSLDYFFPVLATTATANDRVVEDIKSQLKVLNVSRGPLIRESLRIQILDITKKSERFAWILNYIKNTDKIGIIYCLTKPDTVTLNNFLNKNGIVSSEYNADTLDRESIESNFMDNKVQVVVATIALGMGYDKKDIGFVIHYQRPGNIVTYYQQIGRAGRSLKEADVILFNGPEDDYIQKYFIDNSFPKVDDIKDVIHLASKNQTVRVMDIESNFNISRAKTYQILKYLTDNEILERVNSQYVRTNIVDQLDYSDFLEITKLRYEELDDIKEFVRLKTCYMKFLAEKLSDTDLSDCGKCANCLKKELYPSTLNMELLEKAEEFLNGLKYTIIPRKQFPQGIRHDNVFKFITKNYNYSLEEGYALALYNQDDLGIEIKEILEDGKILSQSIILELLNKIKATYNINSNTIITYVPSTSNNNLTKLLATEVSNRLNLELIEGITKETGLYKQEEMNNSNSQCNNAFYNYEVNDQYTNKDVILIDDYSNTKWTLTTIGYKLKKLGAFSVTPYVLAVKSNY